MQSHKNNITIASAGGRKTTLIIEEALKQKDKKILITTYTIENTDQIKSYIISQNGFIPDNITVITWFAFLLKDCVRPYQNYILPTQRVESFDFRTIPAPRIKGGRSNPAWYINKGNYIYKDRVSEFICDCNGRCKGSVIKRLEKIYDQIYIDEMQDLVGWDQNLVELLMESTIAVTLVGDPRQATYSTNNSQKNKGKKGKNMMLWINELKDKNKCIVKEKTECFRSNQVICDFADNLYPDLSKTISKNAKITGHDGVFIIKQTEVLSYIETYNPQILRWSKKTDTISLPAINIGASKGLTYERVLIFPTKRMKKYLETSDINDAGDIPKLYVAVTRAKYSVAFVIDG